MRYVGDIYRPPSEAYSLLVQVTIGCSHNKCTFCNMFKEKQFKVRRQEEVLEDLAWARAHYSKVKRMFLCDGDALCLATGKLLVILDYIRDNFPECERVTLYGRATDILRKTSKELKTLKEHGVTMVYIGAESGSSKVLEMINKGETREQLIEAVRKLEDIGIMTSVTFISGLGGPELWEEHAVETGKMITDMNASYVSLLTLMLQPPAPMYDDYKAGEFKPLTPEEVLAETCLMLQHSNAAWRTGDSSKMRGSECCNHEDITDYFKFTIRSQQPGVKISLYGCCRYSGRR